MKMEQISIDFEVYKEVQKRRLSFDDSPNDVFRRIFNLPEINSQEKTEPNKSNNGLFTKGVLIPNGTKLKSEYKGQIVEAEVVDCFIIYNKKSFNSLSSAAVEATGTSVNGWTFWTYYDQKTGTWQPCWKLRSYTPPYIKKYHHL